jgi:uncharacterized protein (DUF924 family)
MTPDTVIDFWLAAGESRWFTRSAVFDGELSVRFKDALAKARDGAFDHWAETPKGALALIILLDQFSRNIHRGTPAAFAQDPMALALSQEAVRAGATAALSPIQNNFLLMPYMHSESRQVHAVAEPLFREFTPAENHDFELRHKAIVDRFGRYPHRNEALGRTSTPEEIGFLGQPGSSF